jgi:hypothetical protein
MVLSPEAPTLASPGPCLLLCRPCSGGGACPPAPRASKEQRLPGEVQLGRSPSGRPERMSACGYDNRLCQAAALADHEEGAESCRTAL